MNVSEYKKFINEQLDRTLAEVGDVPVVMWYHDRSLSEHVPTLVTNRVDIYVDIYTGKGDRSDNGRRGMVLILGE